MKQVERLERVEHPETLEVISLKKYCDAYRNKAILKTQLIPVEAT